VFRRLVVSFLSASVLLGGCPAPSRSWEEKGHVLINGHAIDSLPEPLRGFFSTHRSTMEKRSQDPDYWKLDDEEERRYHYIDIDALRPYPFTDFPLDYEAATRAFGRLRLREEGELPWRIEEYFDILVQDFENGQWEDAAYTAAILGHYVADLHQPLHTTKNYDGDLTGNKGVHSRFEGNLLDRLGDLTLSVSSAVYVEDPVASTLEVVRSGYPLIRTILQADSEAGRAASGDEERYLGILEQKLRPLVEKRLSEASSFLGSLIYSAWSLAEKPNPPSSPSE